MKTIEPAISQAVELFLRGHTRSQVRGKLECCVNSDGEALTKGEAQIVLNEAEKQAGIWQPKSSPTGRYHREAEAIDEEAFTA